ncbi:MAG: mechanosensitive ion channel [Salinivirgaceae bacterium]|nr:mechanosensitive ion channel [Salinivirgaceae bacterium]
MSISDFLNFQIMEFGNYTLIIKQVLLAVLVLIASLVSFVLAKKYLKSGKLISRLSIKNTKALIRFFRLLIIIIGASLFIQALGFNIKAVLQHPFLKTEKITFNLYNLIVFLVIFFVTRLVLYIIELVFDDSVSSKKLEEGKSQSLFQIVKYFVWVIASTLFLDSIGFSVTFLIASLSALFVGLGFGIQHFFNDIVSGIVILFDHSIKVGDIVEIQGETIGKIEEISLRTSKVISRDDVVIIIPNSKFTSDNVINWSHNSFKTRFGVKVGVAYGSDVRKVEQLLIEAAKEHPQIDNEPEARVLFRDFGDSSLDFELMFMTDQAFRVEIIKSELRFAINQKFAENNVTIPFPQRDVHFYKE